jgi:hypothetical protein
MEEKTLLQPTTTTAQSIYRVFRLKLTGNFVLSLVTKVHLTAEAANKGVL